MGTVVGRDRGRQPPGEEGIAAEVEGSIRRWPPLSHWTKVFVILIGVAGAAAVLWTLRNDLIAPRVINRVIDLNPATVIIALLIGGSLAGLVGALLALPVSAMIKIVLFELIVPGRIESLRDEALDSPRPGGRIRRTGARPLP